MKKQDTQKNSFIIDTNIYPPKIVCNGMYFLLKEEYAVCGGGLFYDGEVYPYMPETFVNVPPSFFESLITVKSTRIKNNKTYIIFKFFIPGTLPPQSSIQGLVVDVREYFQYDKLFGITNVPGLYMEYMYRGTDCPHYGQSSIVVDKKKLKKDDRAAGKRIKAREKDIKKQKRRMAHDQKKYERYMRQEEKREKIEREEETFDEQSYIVILKIFAHALASAGILSLSISLYETVDWASNRLFSSVVVISIGILLTLFFIVIYRHPRYLVPFHIALVAGGWLYIDYKHIDILRSAAFCLAVYFIVTALNSSVFFLKYTYILHLILNIALISIPFSAFAFINKTGEKISDPFIIIMIVSFAIGLVEGLSGFFCHEYVQCPDLQVIANERALHKPWRIFLGILGFLFFVITLSAFGTK